MPGSCPCDEKEAQACFPSSLPLPYRPQAPASPSLLCPQVYLADRPLALAEEASRPGTGSNLIPGSSSSLPFLHSFPSPYRVVWCQVSVGLGCMKQSILGPGGSLPKLFSFSHSPSLPVPGQVFLLTLWGEHSCGQKCLTSLDVRVVGVAFRAELPLQESSKTASAHEFISS